MREALVRKNERMRTNAGTRPRKVALVPAGHGPKKRRSHPPADRYRFELPVVVTRAQSMAQLFERDFVRTFVTALMVGGLDGDKAVSR